MLLSARMLQNVANVNTWESADTLKFTYGDTIVVYLQLIDLNKDRLLQGFKPSGKRYMPLTASSATLQITIQNIDSAKTIVKSAVQAFPEDASIFRFSLTPGDALGAGTFSMRLLLTESGVTTAGIVPAALSVVSVSASFV